MKKILALILGASALAAASTSLHYVQAKTDGAGLYGCATCIGHDQAIVQINQRDPLKVLDEKGNALMVQTVSGKVGWLARNEVTENCGLVCQFPGMDVNAYLDNPDIGFVIDALNAADLAPAKIDRSFADAVKENIDREALARSHN